MTTSTHQENGHAARSENQSDRAASESVEALAKTLRELQSYAANYLAARKDALLAQARGVLVVVVLGIAAGGIALTFLIAAATLALIGSADGLGILFGDRPWAGKLVVGFGTLALFALIVFLGKRYLQSRWLAQTKARYEHRHADQRLQFGRSVADRRPSTRDAAQSA
jgi:hypothetical protein